jgi:folate-binding protein YgfZ
LGQLIGGEAVAVAGRLGLVWVDGPDAVSFLDGLLSQDVAGMAPGTTDRSLLLAPNGKMRATLFLLRGDERVGLVCDIGLVDTVIGDLSRFKIRVDAAISVEPGPMYEVWGDMHEDSVPAVGCWTDDAGKLVFAMPLMRHALSRYVVVDSEPDRRIVTPQEIEALRIEVGEPTMGIDLDDRTIPQEGVDVATHVDFTKGCYLGQELVARIDSRGHVNRRLAGLQIEGRTAPDRGTAVLQAGKEIGVTASAAWSEDRGLVVALAMIRVEVGVGEHVTVGERPATVVALPMSP